MVILLFLWKQATVVAWSNDKALKWRRKMLYVDIFGGQLNVDSVLVFYK